PEGRAVCRASRSDRAGTDRDLRVLYGVDRDVTVSPGLTPPPSRDSVRLEPRRAIRREATSRPGPPTTPPAPVDVGGVVASPVWRGSVADSPQRGAAQHRRPVRGVALTPRTGQVHALSVQLQRLPVLSERDPDGVPVADLAAQQGAGELVADRLLPEAGQRARRVRRVVAAPGEPALGRRVDLQREPPRLESSRELVDLDVHDVLELVLAERVEDHHVVQPVDELRLERPLDG